MFTTARRKPLTRSQVFRGNLESLRNLAERLAAASRGDRRATQYFTAVAARVDEATRVVRA